MQQSTYMSAVAHHIFVSYANFYHPQTKFVKVMFSQVFVCPPGGLCPGGVSPGQGGGFLSRVGLCPVGVENLNVSGTLN